MTGSGDSPTIPRYSVAELNGAVASLLERGFAPRFLLDATVSRPQLKKGHLWMTLVDGQASITAVVWASQLARLSFVPADGDGVVVVAAISVLSSPSTAPSEQEKPAKCSRDDFRKSVHGGGGTKWSP